MTKDMALGSLRSRGTRPNNALLNRRALREWRRQYPEINMLFHVTIAVHIPHDADADKIKQLSAQEHERAKELQLQRKWLHLWRVAGSTRTSASSMWRALLNCMKF